jgi:hypothetical protein
MNDSVRVKKARGVCVAYQKTKRVDQLKEITNNIKIEKDNA